MGVATFRRMMNRREGATQAPPVPPEEKHICPECGFEAKTKLTLGSHMRIHKK